MQQQIAGPFMGYYIALYACEMGELGKEYLGHYRIFPERPADYWDHGFLAEKSVGGLTATAHAALAAAEQLAQLHVCQLRSSRVLGTAAARLARPEDTTPSPLTS